MKRMTRVGLLSGTMLLSLAGNPILVRAVGEQVELPRRLMIAEVSPEAVDTGTKEYVVVYNPNSQDTEVTGWTLQYRSASHKGEDVKGWSTRAVLGCNTAKTSDCETLTTILIKAGETLRLSSYETGDGVVPLASGMATSGGELRLIQPAQGSVTEVVVHDKVGYGNAGDFEGLKAAPAPKAGRSIMRLQNEQGAYVDSDHNDADFALTTDENQQEPAGSVPTGSESSPGQGLIKTYLDAEITEIFPDPASPRLDSADEFVELYNPYAEPLDLTGYVLKAGATWTHKYTIKELVIEPFDYGVLMSAQTHLSLSNTGTGVRLYDPSGRLVFEAPSYGKAQAGNSWVRGLDGQWVWTVKPTAGEQNIVEIPAIPAPKAPAASAKKPTAKASSTSAKKASTPKTTGTVQGVATTAPESAGAASTNNQTGMWVLGGAIVLGVGYALFEYRQEMGGFVRRRFDAARSFFGRR